MFIWSNGEYAGEPSWILVTLPKVCNEPGLQHYNVLWWKSLTDTNTQRRAVHTTSGQWFNALVLASFTHTHTTSCQWFNAPIWTSFTHTYTTSFSDVTSLGKYSSYVHTLLWHRIVCHIQSAVWTTSSSCVWIMAFRALYLYVSICECVCVCVCVWVNTYVCVCKCNGVWGRERQGYIRCNCRISIFY